MNKDDLKVFIESWITANEKYKSLTDNMKHRVGFPDPLQKKLINEWFPNQFKENTNPKTYDFTDVNGKQVEVKSSCANGCTPFGSNQIACDRILYLDISLCNIKVYELDQTEVSNVNNRTTDNIILSNYLSNSKLLYTYTF